MSTISTTPTGTLSAAQLALFNGTSGTSSTSGSSSATGTSGSASLPTGTSIQNEFLTLFTAQLQNQDPMNPMDSSQMTSQLAQISTVSGINQLNTSVSSLMGSNTVAETAQSASLIGHTVLVPGSTVALTPGTPATLGVSVASAADSVTATIKDSLGNVVRTYSLGAEPAGVANFSWDGKTASGAAAAAGTYTLSVAATNGGSAVGATPLSSGKVTGVGSSSAGVSVDVAGIGSVALATVSQIN